MTQPDKLSIKEADEIMISRVIAGLVAYMIFILGGAFLVSGKKYWLNVLEGIVITNVIAVFVMLVIYALGI